MALGVAGISPSGVEPRVSLLEATVTGADPRNLAPRSPTESSRNIAVLLQINLLQIAEHPWRHCVPNFNHGTHN